MRPALLAPADSAPTAPAPVNPEVVEDLRLDALVAAMADGDDELRDLVRATVLAPLTDLAVLRHRQDVLADCLRHPGAVRALHDLARRAVAAERTVLRGAASGQAEPLLNRSRRVLGLFCGFLRELGAFADRHGRDFHSAGLTALLADVRTHVGAAYLDGVEELLRTMDFDNGIVLSARLGEGGKGVDFRLHEPPGPGRGAVPRRLRKSGLVHTITGHHEQDWRALAAFRGRALAPVAEAAARSADHVLGFFVALRDELGFHIGCLNLVDALAGLGVPTCLPRLHPAGERVLTARDLAEPCLALGTGGPVVGGDLDASGSGLVLVTGRNCGGKSTFLRALGLAQLMAQCGMVVAARDFAVSVATGVCTHFTRAEDRAMTSGKLDEELARMSRVVDLVTPGALVLCNESFAATDEREAAAIATEVLHAFVDLDVRVVFVTHLHELARTVHDGALPALSLTATDGFRIVPGPPSPTAHAGDLHARIFGDR